MVLQDCLLRADDETHDLVNVVMSEPPPVELVLTAPVVRMHKETSQDQI